MREIKFRAWDKEEQEMLDWDKVLNLDIAQVFESKGSWGVYPMQYTGAKDLNNTEIYEDDIIVWAEETNHGISLFKAVVVWSEDSLEYIALNELGWSMCLYEIIEKNGYIVGNVHENSELLKTQ